MSMRQVTKGEFFATVGGLDVVLRTERDATYWEKRDRTVVGRSTPSYIGMGEKAWFVDETQL